VSGFRFHYREAGEAELVRSNSVAPVLLDAAKDIQRAFARSVSRSVMGARGRTDVATTYDSSVDEQVGQVLPNDPGWHLLEYGTASQPPTRQIMHAVEAAGYTFVDGGR
jgi:hypothetical protein